MANFSTDIKIYNISAAWLIITKETGYGLPCMGIGLIAFILIQLPNMADQSVPDTRMQFHDDMNNN